MTKIKHRLVEPLEEPSSKDAATRMFLRAGWSQADAEWLGPLCVEHLRKDPGSSEIDRATECNIGMVASAWQSGCGDRDRALLIAYMRLCDCGGEGGRLTKRLVASQEKPQAPMGLEEWKVIAGHFRSPGPGIPGADFERAIISGGWPGRYTTEIDPALQSTLKQKWAHYDLQELVRVMRVLVQGASLDLTQVIDCETLAATGAKRILDPSIPQKLPPIPERKRPNLANPRALVTWMIGMDPSVLNTIFPLVSGTTDPHRLAALASGIQDAIENWLICLGDHWTYFFQGGVPLAQGAQPYIKLLGNHFAASEVTLRQSWLWFAWCTYCADPNLWQQLDLQEQEVLLRSANEDLARLRPLFSKATMKPPGAPDNNVLAPGQTRASWEEFLWHEPHFTTCIIFLYQFGGVWRGMKPLLLAIRSMACPCVASDLRFWAEKSARKESDDPLPQPPEPWFTIPASMINLFHVYVGQEQVTDPELKNLRGELAAFCLERLGDRMTKAQRDTGTPRTDDDMIERSPEWRLCLIRALLGLYINPEGKGHRVLQKASEIDPNEEVREAAREGYQQMRRLCELPENVSPRRAVMTALWWIRQAHLLGLEFQPDPDGAQRTRAKELDYTKENERAARLGMKSIS